MQGNEGDYSEVMKTSLHLGAFKLTLSYRLLFYGHMLWLYFAPLFMQDEIFYPLGLCQVCLLLS